MSTTTLSPVLVTGRLDAHLSRWLWLVKWLLVLPHLLVLAVLWPVFVVASIGAAGGILLTGRYPRALFDLNAGILRWTWRVHYYAYGALGTDQYPPFTLRDVPDYPARLQIAYPEHLSRGLVLVKWWLLALPHYLVLAVLLGGGWWALGGSDGARAEAPGLIAVLVLVAGVALAVSGRYPQGLFDLVVGLDRWVLRVAAYAGLMTDSYPPFRLDLGGQEAPGAVLVVDAPPPEGPRPDGTGTRSEGTLPIVLGALLLLPSLGVLAGGAGLLWVDQTQRDEAGFVTSAGVGLGTSSRALVTEPLDLHLQVPEQDALRALVGDVRLRVTAASAEPVFVGLGPAAEVQRYLTGVDHAVVHQVRGADAVVYLERPAGSAQLPAGAQAPGDQDFWIASDVGTGTRSLSVPARDGRWTAVVMHPDARPGLAVTADVGAQAPALAAVAGVLVVVGAVLAGGAAVLLAVGARSASAQPDRS